MSERDCSEPARDTTAAPPSPHSDSELTVQQAADLLHVSHAFLVGLPDAGEVEYRTVGTCRRITKPSLTEYKRRDDRRRSEALDELVRLGQEMGPEQSPPTRYR